MRADLVGRALPAGARGLHEVGRDGARDVHHLQPHPGVGGQEEGAVDRLLLDERRARLVVRERVPAPLGPQPRAVRLQQRVVLRVHQHEAVEAGDDAHALQELGVVDVRVGRVGVRHEGLEAQRALRVLALDVRQRRGGQRAPEAEVRDDLALGHVALGAEQVDRRHRRIGQRVLDDGGEAACGRRAGAGREVLALRVAGILEVRVHVDRARQHHEAARVDHLVRARERVVVDRDRRDALAVDDHVGREDAVVGGDRAVGDDRPLALAHRSSSPSSAPQRTRVVCRQAEGLQVADEAGARPVPVAAETAADAQPVDQPRDDAGLRHGLEVGPQDALRGAGGEHVGDQELPVAVGLHQHRGKGRVALGVRPHLRPEAPLLLARRVVRDALAHHRVELAERVRARVDAGAGGRDPVVGRGLEAGRDQRLLVGEPVAGHAGGEAALAGDVAQGGRLQALAQDHALRGGDELGAPVDAPPARARGGVTHGAAPRRREPRACGRASGPRRRRPRRRSPPRARG